MIFQLSDLNEEVHGSRGFSGWFPFPLIRPSGTFSLEGEGFPSLLEIVDSATPGKLILPERTLSLDVWRDRP